MWHFSLSLSESDVERTQPLQQTIAGAELPSLPALHWSTEGGSHSFREKSETFLGRWFNGFRRRKTSGKFIFPRASAFTHKDVINSHTPHFTGRVFSIGIPGACVRFPGGDDLIRQPPIGVALKFGGPMNRALGRNCRLKSELIFHSKWVNTYCPGSYPVVIPRRRLASPTQDVGPQPARNARRILRVPPGASPSALDRVQLRPWQPTSCITHFLSWVLSMKIKKLRTDCHPREQHFRHAARAIAIPIIKFKSKR